MQNLHPESSNHFYFLLDFPSVKQETTECSVPQRNSRRGSLLYIRTHLNQLRPNCRTRPKVQTGNSCINLAPQKFAKCTKKKTKIKMKEKAASQYPRNWGELSEGCELNGICGRIRRSTCNLRFPKGELNRFSNSDSFSLFSFCHPGYFQHSCSWNSLFLAVPTQRMEERS